MNNIDNPKLTLIMESIKSDLQNTGNLLGIFLRGSHARGDFLTFSDYDMVVLSAAKPENNVHSGYKVLVCGEKTDIDAILSNPVRPLDLRDAIILYDPLGAVQKLKEKCMFELDDHEKVTKRARKLLDKAAENIKVIPDKDVISGYPFTTRFILDLARAFLVKNSITPSGRRLLYQIFSMGDPVRSSFIGSAGTVLGIRGITAQEAEFHFNITAEYILENTAITNSPEFGTLLTSERLQYWKEGFYYLLGLDIISASWITSSLLQFIIQFQAPESPGLSKQLESLYRFFRETFGKIPAWERVFHAQKLLNYTESYIGEGNHNEKHRVS
jgi:predicted nucleotidyltransferase